MRSIVETGLAIALAMLLQGCATEPTIQSTQPWEGHYFTVEEFNNGTSNVALGKDESIWVMSNTTLNRLLKNVGK